MSGESITLNDQERCQHTWAEYLGFLQPDIYCTKCDMRVEWHNNQHLLKPTIVYDYYL